ncbi:MAG TPA: zinc ribbon domain-containing protein [Candidatus Deferrimicrobium sp.]|nr:zinc ribbon domain-containing protein [Candidatus Deferrimicrobium sp.]
MQFEAVIQWLIDNIHVILLSLPGIAGLLWKYLDWRKSRRLLAEQFAPRLDINFISTCYSKELNKYVAGNLIFENIGDLTAEIKDFKIRVSVEGDLVLDDVHFYRDRNNPMKTTEFLVDGSGKSAYIEYVPVNQGKWFICEPKRKFYLPILIVYHEAGNGNLLLNAQVTTTLTRRLSAKDTENYNNEIKEIEESSQFNLDTKIEFNRYLLKLYEVIHESFLFFKEWRPRQAHAEDIKITLKREFANHMYPLFNLYGDFIQELRGKYLDKDIYPIFQQAGYNLQELKNNLETVYANLSKTASDFRRNISSVEKIDRKEFEGNYKEFTLNLKSISDMVRKIIQDTFQKIKSKLSAPILENLINLRFVLIESENPQQMYQIIQNMEGIEVYFNELLKTLRDDREREKTEKIEKQIERQNIQEIQTSITNELQKFKYLEFQLNEAEREKFLNGTFNCEFFDESTNLDIQYQKTYNKYIEKYAEKNPYQFDEIFYIATPEAIAEAKTVTDLELKYDVIFKANEKYLHGKLLIINKRNVKTRFQGFNLFLESIDNENPIQFYHPDKNTWIPTINLLEFPLIQNWLQVLPDETLPKFEVPKVRATTWPFMQENIDFIVKVRGTGFFKFTAELVSSPIISETEEFYRTDLASKNVEQFVGYIGTGVETIVESPLIPKQSSETPSLQPPAIAPSKTIISPPPKSHPIPETKTQAEPSLDVTQLEKSLYEGESTKDEPEIITGLPSFGTPGDKQMKLHCPQCGNEITVDSKTLGRCPYCQSNLDELGLP